jgi:putative Mg2+ transporter-C (MgtC) family protein
MNWMDFTRRLFAALLLGGAIGLGRQWRQRMTGLRPNGLVAVGAAEDASIPASRESVRAS